LAVGAYDRHGSLRRLGQGGNPAGGETPGTTGSTKLDGMLGDIAIETCEVPVGTACANAHTGCAPFGAAIVTRIRVPAR
jgi:hypothetical protein